jgi:hypothetical protein
LEGKEQELDEIRKKTKLYQEEQLKKAFCVYKYYAFILDIAFSLTYVYTGIFRISQMLCI